MRVALCLHGHFRTFEACFGSLKSRILDPYSPDVFMMAWTDSTGTHQHPQESRDPHQHPGYDSSSPAVPHDYISRVLDALKPVGVHLDSYHLHDQRFQAMVESLSNFHHPSPHHRPKGTMSLNWTRSVVMALKRHHELTHGFRYDRVICTRWDMEHSYPIDLHAHDPNLVVLPNVHGPDVTSDVWASGPSHLLDAWAEQFYGINQLVANGTFSLGTHEWMKAWFLHRQIPWQNRDDLGVWTRR